jgi:predicted AAA+ superfamily ATPase
MKETRLDGLMAGGLEAALRNDNPWWRGERMFGLPPMRRHVFDQVLSGLKHGLAPITVLRGPRQVGKTTLMSQAIDALLADGVSPNRVFRLQFDLFPELNRVRMPILSLVQWYADRILGKSLNQAAHDGEQVFLFLDEVQNLPHWAPELKHLVDLQPVRVAVTGSSSLRIEAGRDSLAGRIATFEMGPLLLREIAALRGFGELKGLLPQNGLAPLKDKQFWLELRHYGEANRAVRDLAYAAFSERGGFPFVHVGPERPWEAVADQLVETVVKRVIMVDLGRSAAGAKRDERLMEAVFRLACRYCGQAPDRIFFRGELQEMLGEDISWQKLLVYLKYLDNSLLLRLVDPLELRLKRRRGPGKVCLSDHALRAAWLQEVVPLAPAELQDFTHLSELAGRVAESTVGYFFASMYHLDVAHFPARDAEPEVDFVLTVGTQRIPVEVKYRRKVEFRDTFGLRRFIEQSHNNAPFGVLVTLADEVASDDPRIVTLPLSSLLLLR